MSKINFIQLGANVGKSPTDIMWIISRKFNWKGIFVEPHPEAFKKLKEYYSDTEGHYFEQVAIVPNKMGNMDLYYEPDHLVTSSLTKNHARRNHTEKVSVPTTTLRDLIIKYNLLNVEFDLLQIDIEGQDGVVLLGTDFSDILPKILRYESIHLSGRPVPAHLESHGYTRILKDPYYEDYKNAGGAEPESYNTVYEKKLKNG